LSCSLCFRQSSSKCFSGFRIELIGIISLCAWFWHPCLVCSSRKRCRSGWHSLTPVVEWTIAGSRADANLAQLPLILDSLGKISQFHGTRTIKLFLTHRVLGASLQHSQRSDPSPPARSELLAVATSIRDRFLGSPCQLSVPLNRRPLKVPALYPRFGCQRLTTSSPANCVASAPLLKSSEFPVHSFSFLILFLTPRLHGK